MLAGGMTLMLLRLHSDVLWLPVGYHWAWNVLQAAVFGAVSGASWGGEQGDV
jgi:membrane protease YdiL (CAAX protease family)